MIQGALESIDQSRVRGWAFDSENPDHHLTIEFVRDGKSFGATKANVFRTDLLRAGFGAGDHAFVHQFPAPLHPANVRTVQVRACAADGSKIQLTPARPPAPGAAPPLRFPGLSSDPGQHPVFVLGAVRSGTSAMVQGLLTLDRYRGFSEGHILDLLHSLHGQLEDFYQQRQRARQQDTMVARVPIAFLEDGISHVFAAMAQQLFPANFWVEKTPNVNAIHVAPRLRHIWPNARFILMRRRALEYLASRARKWPTSDFTDNCNEWRHAMQAWIDVRASLRGAAVEIDQLTLARHPRRVADALQGLLDLDADMTGILARALAGTRAEQTAKSIAAVLDLNATGWSSARIEEFARLCGPAMQQFGYTTDRAYHRAGDDGGLVLI
jgi:hypothetical protein